jgi:hypothetical protein
MSVCEYDRQREREREREREKERVIVSKMYVVLKWNEYHTE